MEKRLRNIMIINGIIVAFIILLDFLFIKEIGDLFSSILLVAIIMLIVPFALYKYYENWKIKILEDFFPQFMHDLVEGVRSGMTLLQAVETISENDYGRLSSYVKKLNVQLNWGIPFDKAFLRFSRNTKSKLIGRITATIIESHRFGGNLIDVFESISSASVEIERLREERKLYMSSQLMTGYIIYFVFLMVIIGLQKFLIPTLTGISVGELGPVEDVDLGFQYKSMFRNLIILQGLFAGLVIGKMSGGAVASGVKHSLFLLIAGLLIFSFAA